MAGEVREALIVGGLIAFLTAFEALDLGCWVSYYASRRGILPPTLEWLVLTKIVIKIVLIATGLAIIVAIVRAVGREEEARRPEPPGERVAVEAI